MLIAYYLGFTNTKRKFVEDKTMVRLKTKQKTIATVRNHLRTLASFPTFQIFHWTLQVRMELDQRKCTLGLKGFFLMFSPLDEGFYTCVAGNILGETVSSAYLQEGLHLKTTFELLTFS